MRGDGRRTGFEMPLSPPERGDTKEGIRALDET
jgi:hypothetical protein